jgi:small conductance mechanosensitive channel
MSDTMMELLLEWGPRVVGAVVVLLGGLAVARLARRGIKAGLTRRSVDATLVPFIGSMAYYLILAFVVMAVLGFFGVQVASLVAVLGAAAFAVGLALQGTLSNFAAGVMLLLFRPFRVGDFVDVGGTTGAVVEIGIFSTRLNTPDNVAVIVPNASVWGQTIKNFAANDLRRNDLVIGVSYTDNLDAARSTIVRVLESDERVLKEPEMVVAVSELADSSVNFVVRPWCKKEDYWTLRWDLTRRIKDELEAAGCSIPFPQRDVHLIGSGKEDGVPIPPR